MEKIKDLAVVDEILHGGYMNLNCIIEQAKSGIQDRLRQANCSDLISLKYELVNEINDENLSWLTEKSAGFRYLLLGGLHDFLITSVNFYELNDKKYVVFDLNYENCFNYLKFDGHLMSLICDVNELPKGFDELKNLRLPVGILQHGLSDFDSNGFVLSLTVAGLKNKIKIGCNDVGFVGKWQ